MIHLLVYRNHRQLVAHLNVDEQAAVRRFKAKTWAVVLLAILLLGLSSYASAALGREAYDYFFAQMGERWMAEPLAVMAEAATACLFLLFMAAFAVLFWRMREMIKPLSKTKFCEQYEKMVDVYPELKLLPPNARTLYAADYFRACDLISDENAKDKQEAKAEAVRKSHEACARLHSRI